MLNRLIFQQLKNRTPGPGGTPTPDPGDPGTGTGDPNSYNELTLNYTGIDSRKVMANWYAPDMAESFSNNINWRNNSGTSDGSSTSEPFSTNRMHAWGPHYLERQSTVHSGFVYMRGGTNSGRYRVALYKDNGNATLATVDPSGLGSRPLELVGISAEVTVPASMSKQWVEFPLNLTNVPAGFYWRVIWCSSDTNAAQILVTVPGSRSMRIRSNSGTPAYSTSGTPSNFPSSGSTSSASRVDVSFYYTYSPEITNTPTLSLTANANGSITIASTGVSGAQRYQIQRSKNGGSYATIATVRTFPYVDTDLQNNAIYAYRAAAIIDSGISAYSNPVSATATGTRFEYADIAFSELPDNTNLYNGLRGVTGKQQANVLPQYEKYERDFVWRDFEATRGVYNFSKLETFLNTLGSTERAWIRFRTSVSNKSNTLPDWIKNNSNYYAGTVNGGEYPKWDNVIEFIEQLFAEFGAQYGTDSRIGLVDVGVYSDYGEWANEAGAFPASNATKSRIITAVCNAFSTKPCVMSCIPCVDATSEQALYDAITRNNVVALRKDNLGDLVSPHVWSLFYGDLSNRIRMRIAEKGFLKVVEHKDDWTDTGSSNWRLSRDDVRDLGIHVMNSTNMTNYSSLNSTNKGYVDESIRLAGFKFVVDKLRVPPVIVNGQSFYITGGWQNIGNGPLVETRYVQYQLRNTSTGAIVKTFNSSLDLKTLTPLASAITHQDVVLFSGVSAGTYNLCIQVPAIPRTLALKLFISGAQSGDYYVVRQVTVQ